jgi:Mrp family chromosome partitioning ATPase
LVVFDLPPVLATDDALAFSSYIDAILLVLERGKTDREEIKRAGKLLRDTNLIGTVLNKSDEENPGFY